MEINGREIASNIYTGLKAKVTRLHSEGIDPHLVVLLVGQNPSSIAYVNQKKIWAEFIGAKITVDTYPEHTSQELLENRIRDLNADNSVHAVLVQIPLPPHLDAQKLTELVSPEKDIDGFHPDSPFTPPLAAAVMTILEEIKQKEGEKRELYTWLQSKQIVVLGKGKAGGMPIHKLFSKHTIHHTVIDSQTKEREALMHNADIIITAVGKKRIVTSDTIKNGVMLIGVGMNLNENRKLFGDYDIDDIKEKASYYTTTPGGVGPVNVACLLRNLINALSITMHNK